MINMPEVSSAATGHLGTSFTCFSQHPTSELLFLYDPSIGPALVAIERLEGKITNPSFDLQEILQYVLRVQC